MRTGVGRPEQEGPDEGESGGPAEPTRSNEGQAYELVGGGEDNADPSADEHESAAGQCEQASHPRLGNGLQWFLRP
jgi:hypothetical protein